MPSFCKTLAIRSTMAMFVMAQHTPTSVRKDGHTIPIAATRDSIVTFNHRSGKVTVHNPGDPITRNWDKNSLWVGLAAGLAPI